MSDKLEGLKEGQRVRVISEAVIVSTANGRLRARLDGDPYVITFCTCYVEAPTFRLEALTAQTDSQADEE